MSDDLETKIKQLIISSLGLEDITVADIPNNLPLFGDEGLGLDSVDALELGLVVQKNFGIVLEGEQESIKQYFANVASLASLVREKSTSV